MIDQAKIKEILPIFLELKDSGDAHICKAIEELGIERETAERISAFFPSAFCRVALADHLQVEFPDSYMINGSDKLYPYKEEPIYAMGIELASIIYHHEQELSGIFNSIVTRSAECDAINRALNAGEGISGSKLSPIRYFGYKTIGKRRNVFSRLFS
ncbi:hypothetical protein GCM10011352_28430 [Marinobacterium zhoushanense]|uniref:Uncharacterized protein n=1 Tax=Marinobacterium zhoushanense TaxID=1679163 RepID=A0ABQ1KIY7_9GAMM|nr:hypothetical protein [Marinobacterium zhoushanense]GGC00583.1 hypothetical protein GCM10011352_28430 [Marinobacterium zhoushanense]